jgi:hypothetical protein
VRWAPPPAGAPVITFDWYRSFLQLLVDSNRGGWFSYLIAFGEMAVGVGLILGAFVGVAAAGGLMLNFAFLLAGTTSTNPVLVALGFPLILAWNNAGYIEGRRLPRTEYAAEPKPVPPSVAWINDWLRLTARLPPRAGPGGGGRGLRWLDPDQTVSPVCAGGLLRRWRGTLRHPVG